MSSVAHNVAINTFRPCKEYDPVMSWLVNIRAYTRSQHLLMFLLRKASSRSTVLIVYAVTCPTIAAVIRRCTSTIGERSKIAFLSSVIH
jgi:hypothetical protein